MRTSECPNFAIRFSEMSAVFFQHSTYKYTLIHALTHKFAMSACVRMSRGCIFFGTHLIFLLFVLFSFSGFLSLFLRGSVFAHFLLDVCVCVRIYVCTRIHLGFIELTLTLNEFLLVLIRLFFIYSFRFFARAQPKWNEEKEEKATKFIANCNRPSGLKYVCILYYMYTENK